MNRLQQGTNRNYSSLNQVYNYSNIVDKLFIRYVLYNYVWGLGKKKNILSTLFIVNYNYPCKSYVALGNN